MYNFKLYKKQTSRTAQAKLTMLLHTSTVDQDDLQKSNSY